MQGKNAQGVETLARRTLYRQGTKSIVWDHVGLRSDRTLAILSVQCPSREFYQKLEPEIQQIINGIRLLLE